MADNFADQFETALGDYLLRGVTLNPSGTLYVALCANIPTEPSTGATADEIANAGSYARQATPRDTTTWTRERSPAASGLSYNAVQISFPVATVAWGNISGIKIVDTNIYGAGMSWFVGSLTTPKFIDINDQLIVPISGISIEFK